MYTTLILSIIVTMLFSAFFSGMEIAFVSSNRMLVEMERDRYTLSSRPLQIFFSHPNNFVSTMLVGNNIALVIYGILIARLFDQTIFSGMPESVSVPLDTIISTIIVLFTGEFLPKTIFKSSPNYLLRLFAYPAMICYIVLWPVSRFASLLSHLVLKLSGNKDGPSGFFLYITLRIMKLTGTAEPMAMMAAYSLAMPAHRKRARNACWQT